MSPHDSSSKRTFANPSKFLWTLRSTDWKWTAVDRRRGITAAEGHRGSASNSTGGPDNAVPSLPGSDSWLSKKKQNKKNPKLVPARLGAVKLHFRCCQNILDVGLVTRLWLCLTVSPAAVRSSHDRCTRQASGLWQWCNGKAIEALAGRRPTARWLCLRKLVFVRLPLLP